jgi:hypothetical protein
LVAANRSQPQRLPRHLSWGEPARDPTIVLFGKLITPAELGLTGTARGGYGNLGREMGLHEDARASIAVCTLLISNVGADHLLVPPDGRHSTLAPESPQLRSLPPPNISAGSISAYTRGQASGALLVLALPYRVV